MSDRRTLIAAPTGGSTVAPLVPTAVKTANYTAAAQDFVPVDTTSGAVTVTLPAAPADKTQVAIKHVIQGGTNAVTVACGGSDVLNKAGGSTSFTMPLLAQDVILQYKATGAIWYVLADDLPLGQLDLRYAPLASPALTGSPTAPTQSSGDNSTKLATTAYVDAVATTVQVDTQSGTTYTLVLSDAGKVVRCTNASAVTLTVPTNASVAFPVGTVLNVYAAGAGGTTIAAAGGVTIRNNSAALAQYAEVSLRKDATDEWVRIG